MDCALQFTWIARALLLSLSLCLYGIWLHISIDFPYIPMHISTLQKAMIFQTFSLHVSHLLKYNLGATHWCIRWYIDGVLHWYINAMLTQWKPIIRYLSIHIHGLLYLCYTICYVLSTICTNTILLMSYTLPSVVCSTDYSPWSTVYIHQLCRTRSCILATPTYHTLRNNAQNMFYIYFLTYTELWTLHNRYHILFIYTVGHYRLHLQYRL